MDINKLTVEGHAFHTAADYEAACRDKNKIDAIRRKVDFKRSESVLSLYGELEEGIYEFESIIGREFDDEIFDLAERARQSRKEKAQNEGLKQHAGGKLGRISASGRKKQSSAESETLAFPGDEAFRQEVLRELKKREKRRSLTLAGLSIIALCSIGYFISYYYMADRSSDQFATLSELKDSTALSAGLSNTQEYKEVLDKYKSLYNKNKSLIGWVTIDDTLSGKPIIDYPVMKSANEEYYLNHNFNQEKDRNGSIFMDAACDAKKPSDNMIIYGHNMKSGKMFGSLSKYEQEAFYKKHKRIKFDTIFEEGTYEVMYAFRSRLYSEEEIVFKYYQFIDADTEEEFNSNMHEMAAISLYNTGVTAEYGDKLLTLSTCDYNEKNGRFVVVAKRVS